LGANGDGRGCYRHDVAGAKHNQRKGQEGDEPPTEREQWWRKRQ